MKFTCKAMLFDFDGTLIDSTTANEIGWKIWADHHQVKFDHILSVHHGRRPLETISIVAPHLDATREATLFLDDQENLFEGMCPIDGSETFFNSLPISAIAIVTSAPRQLCLRRLEFIGLRTDMLLITSESVKIGKPDPEGFLFGASSLKVRPQDCLAFEDSIAGIAAAKSAGMKVIALQSTHSADDLKEADLIIKSYNELKVEYGENGFMILTKN